jgi:hypothetical protein
LTQSETDHANYPPPTLVAILIPNPKKYQEIQRQTLKECHQTSL